LLVAVDDASLHLPFAQKFSKPKSIIDELSAWSWKAPPRRLAFIDLNLWQIKRRLLQVILVPFFVPFIWTN